MSITVNSVADVCDALDAGFPQTRIENLCDQNGRELPIRGVFFADDRPNRLVVLHSKSESYYFQSREDAIDQSIIAYKAVKAMGADTVRMSFSFNKGYNVAFTVTKDWDTATRKFMFANDIMFPEYRFSMSYTSTHRGNGGSHRIICSNLLTTAMVAGLNFSIRHTKNMGEKLNDINEGVAAIANNYPKFLEYCEAMGKRVVNPVDFYTALYGSKPVEAGRGQTVWTKRYDAIKDRLDSESSKLGIDRNNAWLVFNAVQGYLQNDTTRKVDDYISRGLDTAANPILAKAEHLALGV